jgi:hypothetical protein
MFMHYQVTTYCFLRTQISERNEGFQNFRYSAKTQGVIDEANLLTGSELETRRQAGGYRLASSPAHWMVDLG